MSIHPTLRSKGAARSTNSTPNQARASARKAVRRAEKKEEIAARAKAAGLTVDQLRFQEFEPIYLMREANRKGYASKPTPPPKPTRQQPESHFVSPGSFNATTQGRLPTWTPPSSRQSPSRLTPRRDEDRTDWSFLSGQRG